MYASAQITLPDSAASNEVFTSGYRTLTWHVTPTPNSSRDHVTAGLSPTWTGPRSTMRHTIGVGGARLTPTDQNEGPTVPPGPCHPGERARERERAIQLIL